VTEFFSFAQIVGYVALVTYVLAYLIRDDKKLKLAFSGSNVFWVLHYYLINAHTAALTTAIIIVRNLLSLNSKEMPENKKRIFVCVFSVLLIVAGIVTWAGPVSIIPVATTILITYSMFYLHGITLRKVFFAVDMAWLLHAVIVASVGGFVYAIGSLAFNAYTTFKMIKEQRIKLAAI
jgi:hypothetical protein